VASKLRHTVNVLREVGLPSRIATVFDRMELADRLVRRAEQDHGELDFSPLFRALCPPAVLHDKSDALYLAHCAELVDRFTAGASLQPGTDAECLAIVSDTSLRAPLNTQFAAVADHLFQKLFPDAYQHVGSIVQEPWFGAVAEVMTDLRRKAGEQGGRDC
jgi:hypothetical protein